MLHRFSSISVLQRRNFGISTLNTVAKQYGFTRKLGTEKAKKQRQNSRQKNAEFM